MISEVVQFFNFFNNNVSKIINNIVQENMREIEETFECTHIKAHWESRILKPIRSRTKEILIMR